MNKPQEYFVLNFAPTGMTPTKSMTEFVPVSPAEIIEQVHAASEIGITIVHLHARESDGRPSSRVEVYDEIIGGIRKHCPELVICASLSGRDCPELEKRSQVLELKPDMGSLTLSSLNFARQASANAPDTIAGLIEAMDRHGVHPELECFDSGMINYSKYLIRKNMLKPPFYYNLLLGNIANTQADIGHLGLMLRDLPDESSWSLAGLGDHQLAMNTIAVALGGGVRVGLEDNIWYDRHRTKLATNPQLIERIHRIADEFGTKVMPPSEFGNRGFYNKSREESA